MEFATLEARKGHKLDLLDLIKGNGTMTYKKLLGIFSLKTGISTKTAKTYISELIDAELVTIKGDKVVSRNESGSIPGDHSETGIDSGTGA